MIVRIFSSGSSFKGLTAYLTHDPDAETTERVGFTHTLNCADDHVPSAVNEMVWTARDAELLKQEAGVRGGGRTIENPAKHVSLNWAPGDTPSRKHMIETSEGFLRHMGWQDHQTIIVSHTDKPHAHVHLTINAVHPETGLKLDDNFERRRAQAWALEYERERGRIDCAQRLKEPHERQDAPTREAWLAFQKNQQEFERTEAQRRENADKSARSAENPENRTQADWQILKRFQREEREGFFTDGKAQFSEIRASIFQGVREDFRGRWAELYAQARDGMDPDLHAEAKAALVAEQKAVLEQRRDQACEELRGARDTAYRDLLDHQNDTRLIFRDRLRQGLDNAPFFEQLRAERDEARISTEAFREAGDQITNRTTVTADSDERDNRGREPAAQGGSAAGGGLGILGFGLLNIGESLFATFIADPGARAREREQGRRDPFELAAEEATRRLEQRQRDEADEDWRERQKTLVRD